MTAPAHPEPNVTTSCTVCGHIAAHLDGSSITGTLPDRRCTGCGWCARVATIGPDAVWPLVPGTTGLYASPDGRWRAHVETYGAAWILRDMDRSGAERGFYSLRDMRDYVRRQYPDAIPTPESMEDRS